MTRTPGPTLEPARATELVRGFSGQHIVVAGDVMLDRFIVGRVTRISPEKLPAVASASRTVIRFSSPETFRCRLPRTTGTVSLGRNGGLSKKAVQPDGHFAVSIHGGGGVAGKV